MRLWLLYLYCSIVFQCFKYFLFNFNKVWTQKKVNRKLSTFNKFSFIFLLVFWQSFSTKHADHMKKSIFHEVFATIPWFNVYFDSGNPASLKFSVEKSSTINNKQQATNNKQQHSSLSNLCFRFFAKKWLFLANF